MNRDRQLSLFVLACLLTGLMLGCGGGQNKKPPADPEPKELSVSQQMQLAQSQMTAGRVGESLATLDGAVATEPDNARLHQFYGETCLSGGLLQDAEKAFQKALELDPYLTDAHLYLGAVYQEMDRLADAEQQYLLALNNPAYPAPEKIYLGLGMLYQRQMRLDEAEKQLRTSVGIDPKFYRGHFELAGILEERGDLSEAIAEYVVAEPGFVNDAQYHYRLGFAYFRNGERHQARSRLNRAVDLAPGSVVAKDADDLLKMID
jgi:type IV pilus assembly protein PilF